MAADAAAAGASAAADAADPVHHALASPWSFFEQRSKKGDTEKWKARCLEVCTVDTVESFWAVWNLLPSVLDYMGFKDQQPVTVEREDEVERGQVRNSTCNELSLFRKGILPFGESTVEGSEQRHNLSRLEIRLSLRRPEDVKAACDLWEHIVLSAVGETLLDDSSIVNGVRIMDKTRGTPAWRIEIWLGVDEHNAEAKSAKRTLPTTLQKAIHGIKSMDLKLRSL